MKLVLPLPPNAANSRRHWRVALRQKKAYWRECDTAYVLKRIPRHYGDPLDPARIAVTLYVHQVMDPDNAMARLKPLLDWLCAMYYIADDSPAHLKWVGLPEQVIDRKNPRVEITLDAI